MRIFLLSCTHPLLFSKLFQPEYTFADGDGTVPAESAMVQYQKRVITQFSCAILNFKSQTHGILCTQADNFDAVERVAVCATHRGLLCDENVYNIIKNWVGVPTDVKARRTSKVVHAN